MSYTIDIKYRPVSYDPKAALEKDLRDPEFKAAWESIQDEFAALDVLLEARRKAGLTQEDVAARMGVSQPALARVEASLGSHKHSPSFATLQKYAQALGCKLEIKFTPQ